MSIHTDQLETLPEPSRGAKDRMIQPMASTEDNVVERALRPKQLEEYIGQQKAREQLEIFISLQQWLIMIV